MVKGYLSPALLCATLLVAQNPSSTGDSFQRATPIKAQPTQVQPSKSKLTIKQAALQAINSVRTHPQICSKPTTQLNWNKHLYNMSKEHAIDMAVTGLLQHNGSGTKTDVTARRLQLPRGTFFYERVNQKIDSKNLLSGELIIRTSVDTLSSPKTILSYWIKNPKNCQLLMDPKFTDFAMAKVISNKDNRAYWTLLIAGKRK